MSLFDSIKNAWSVFTPKPVSFNNGLVTSTQQGRGSQGYSTSRSSLSGPVYNRIALDVSVIDFVHTKTDDLTNYSVPMESEIINRLTRSANIDQTGKTFIQDAVYTMMEEGCVALVPVETTADPAITDAYDIKELRVGTVVEWFADSVRVDVYDQNDGLHKQVIMKKKNVAIIYNPLYDVMNDRNGTLKRLTKKLNNLDKIDDNIANGRLQLFIQFPYQIATKLKKKEAEERVKTIEEQISNSRNGIAYLDGTEKITDLGHPIDNNIHDEIAQLTTQFYNQLGLSENVFNGTAKEEELRVYYSRTIDPIVQAFVDEISRKFISQTAYSQGQRISYHRDPFKLMPVDKVATISDTMVRNEILSKDEVRKLIGYAPRNEEGSDELSNPNIAAVNQDTAGTASDVAAPDSKDGSALDSDL